MGLFLSHGLTLEYWVIPVLQIRGLPPLGTLLPVVVLLMGRWPCSVPQFPQSSVPHLACLQQFKGPPPGSIGQALTFPTGQAVAEWQAAGPGPPGTLWESPALSSPALSVGISTGPCRRKEGMCRGAWGEASSCLSLLPVTAWGQDGRW